MSIEASVKELFAKYDADQSGTLSDVDLEGFYADLVANKPELGLTADGLAAWFAKIDKDGSGTVSAEDLKEYLESINYA